MTADSGVGATIGRYRLDGRLGRGGMGEVFRAFDTGRERSVALKLLLRELALDDEFVARFRREARVAARLSDPHILPIHDFGEIEGRLYIDMRLVDGPDLASVLSHGPVPPERTAAIVSQVASGLEAAHREGLVHRDVKPGNILLAAQDPVFAYLTDFGVAAEQGRSEHLTSTGTVIGTVAYLAPEMFDGTRSGAASDIYALGCVLAEMLLGHRPFRTSSIAEAMHAHLSEPPPRPSRTRPDLPAAFDDVIARAMAKEPRQRYATAGEMGAAVLAAVRGAAADAPAATTSVPRTPTPSGPAGSPDTAARGGPVRTTVTGPTPTRPFELLPPRVGRIPVRPDYRPTTEPLRYPAVVPFLGNQRFVDLVRQRIHFSPGGSLLLAGLDGAGKTTVVARALDELHTELVSTEPEPTPLAVVWESVARPTTPGELIVRVLRGLAEALDRNQILARLPDEVAELVELAHRRTSATLWGAHAGTTEHATLPRRRSRSTAEQAHPYGAPEAEYDFLRIVAALAAGSAGEDTPSRRWFRREAAPAWTGRVVVVIDELSQLTRDPAGAAAFEELLRTLVNTLTASSAHFVFVAGADVVDLAGRSQARGDSIWATVFGRPLYLNCLPPGAPAELLAGLTGDGNVHPELPDHLEYRSRGLPRVLLHEFDELVQWHPDGPHLVIDPPTALLVACYASLERRLGPLWAHPRARATPTDPVDVDGRRSATYQVVDWALERRGTTFTASDLRADRAAGVLRRDLASDDECVGLLPELTTTGILEAREPGSPRVTSVGGPGPAEAVYRLSRAVADAVAPIAPAPRELGRVAEGRYVLLEELGRSELGRTYRARDAFHGRDVAIRMLDAREYDDAARARFRREVDLVRHLAHPLLAATLATLDDRTCPGLVSDFVAGLSLADLVARGPLRPPVAVDLALGLVDLVRYLDDEGVVRLDLKPSHVVLAADGRPVVVELGVARRVGDDETRPGGTGSTPVVGTPLYLAPEALKGGLVDVRSDLYSVGLILVEMLLGRPARGGSVTSIVARAATHRPDLTGLPGSEELREVLTTLLDPDPGVRHGYPAALAESLEALPERDLE